MAVVRRTLDERRPLWPLPFQRWLGTFWLPLLAYGLALLALVLVVERGLDIGQRTYDDMWYGFPRQVTVSDYVGHGDERSHPTVMQALNVNGQISILVLPAGNPQALQVLDGPYVVGRDGPYVVPYLDLQDVNGDTHADLLVTVREEIVVYINDDGQFRAMNEEEHALLAKGWSKDQD